MQLLFFFTVKCDSGQKTPEPILQNRFLEDGHRQQYSNSVQVLHYETKNLSLIIHS